MAASNPAAQVSTVTNSPIAMTADALGWTLDRITDHVEPKLASVTISSEFLAVDPGYVCGIVQDGVGFYGIDVPIGILYFFAVGSIAFYGLLLGGWSSGSKYSLLGAMRGAAQLISYEVSMGLALLGVVMMTGSLSLTHVVDGQGAIWNIVPQIIGFLIFMIAVTWGADFGFARLILAIFG